MNNFVNLKVEDDEDEEIPVGAAETVEEKTEDINGDEEEGVKQEEHDEL